MARNRATARQVTWNEANARRLARQGLVDPLDASIPDVVAAMAGAHAQVMSAAEVAIGLRTRGATRSDVRAALWEERSLVKTFGPRGTVHLLPARDLAAWLAALDAVPGRTAMAEGVRLSAEQTDAVVAAVAEALTDEELTIEELDAAVIAATGSWAGDPVMPAFGGYWPRWRQAIGTAAKRGALCYGPDRGRKSTYTSPRRWIANFGPTEAAVALPWLVREYLGAYGPATPAHFARWLAAPVGWATALFTSLDGAIERVDLGGADAWIVAGDDAFPDLAPPAVRLLPYFDPFVVASQPRECLFPGAAASRALAGSQAGNFPVLLIDGTVAGVWHKRRSGRFVDITVEPLGDLTSAQRESLQAEVDRVAETVEAKPRLAIGAVTVGPHA